LTLSPDAHVDGHHPGLSSVEAQQRLAADGPNALPEPPPRPTWLRFVDQFRNLLIVVLIGAAILAGLVGDWKDTIVISIVLLLNAVLGFVQEGKAERSLSALRRMLVATAKVIRDGAQREVPAEQLVVGDRVVVETGDRVPADGRLVVVRSLEIDESSLTGESTPVAKSTDPVAPGTPLAERTSMAHMNTVVTRGRGELVVTATGGGTEMGRLAGMLAAADPGETPLQRQLHVLGQRLALVAGVAVALFLGLNLLRGEPLGDTLLASVALAVAAIPEGLPAVVTVTLAIGVHRLATRGAIVKRLASVETLGSTTVICSDKTGTLTLNQMTARAVVTAAGTSRVSGDGYGAEGSVAVADGAAAAVAGVLRGAALCNDSQVRDGVLMGDPTEGALVSLAAKGGLDPDAVRAEAPRTAEVPFDSARKLMATLHDEGGEAVLYVKGAPDVLFARCPSVDETLRGAVDDLAAEGLRVLGVARRVLPAELLRREVGEDELVALVDDLDLLGLVGLLDPPRAEARDAIALCRRAGIDVKMITGDHATTATAIARQLRIPGGTLRGADLDALSDDQLAEVIDDTGVFARVAPEHKVRLVDALRRRGHTVAMTGDGVNDAPALKTADIGVAMGTTGTEVSKEAADMVLTDDNFATIVRAVESGRTIYANIVKFVRFQLSTNVGAIFTLLGAAVLGMPVPFTAIQVLWVNLIMDGPPAMALGVDPTGPRTMQDPPRDRGERILTSRRLGVVVLTGVVMAVGTLGVLAYGEATGSTEHALAMAFTTFVLFQVFNVFNARDEQGTAFTRGSLRNRKLWAALGVVVVLQVLAVHVDPVQQVFGTADLRPADWIVVVAVASTVLIVEEVRKLLVRGRVARTPRPRAT
ncbi:MAG: HAD-IC family P-type ATPase, partial [Acidimicrobiales bacterium]|nr:HAD-IC family P-type ATPase [Acidimicrobiales bacterium]